MPDRALLPASSGDTAARPSGLGQIFGNWTFCLLFVASIGARSANILIFLSRPLIMQAYQYDATVISTAAAVGSLAPLPLPLVIGWLTDRVGRTMLLLACVAAPIGGLLVQTAATSPWHFWVSSILATIVSMGSVVSATIVSDTSGEELRGSALAALNATSSIGIVLGLSLGGLAIRAFAMTPTLLAATLVSSLALLLLVRLARYAPPPAAPVADAPLQS